MEITRLKPSPAICNRRIFCQILASVPATGVAQLAAGQEDSRATAKPKRIARQSGSTTARLVAQLGHHTSITGVAFSPDGRHVVTGSADDSLRIWDVGTGRELRSIAGDFKAVAISPDGTRIATASGLTAFLWDINTGEARGRLVGHAHVISSVAFSSDSTRILTGSFDGSARIWDVNTEQEVYRLEVPGQAVHSVAFSKDGQQALTGLIDGTARLWNSKAQRQVQRFVGHSDVVSSVGFSADGRYIVTGSWDSTARIWSLSTGKEFRRFARKGAVTSVALSPDGHRIVAAGGGAEHRPWKANSPLTDKQHSEEFSNAAPAAAPQPSAIIGPRPAISVLKETAAGDKTARVWDVATMKEVARLQVDADSVAFSPDGRQVVAGGGDGVAHRWNVETGKELTAFQGRAANLTVLRMLAGNKYLAAGGNAGIRVWDLTTGKASDNISKDIQNVHSLTLTHEGALLVECEDSRTHLCDVVTGKPVKEFANYRDAILYTISSNGDKSSRHLVDNASPRVGVASGLWAGLSGLAPKAFTSRACQSHCGKYIFTSGYQRAFLWEVATGKLLHEFETVEDGFQKRGDVSPDGRLAISIGDKVAELGATNPFVARIFEITSGREVSSFQGQSGLPECVTFSPDGKQVLTTHHDGTARLWDWAAGKEVKRFIGHGSEVCSAVFSPTGRYLMTASTDLTIRLWDATSEGDANPANELCHLISFRDGTWAVVDMEGRFDASNGGDVEGMHWVVGNEAIGLNQLKHRYYEPGLLAKYMGFNEEALTPVQALKEVKLYPQVELAGLTAKQPTLSVLLTNRGGGIGPVIIKVNGKERTADARGPQVNADAAKVELRIDLANDPRVVAGQENVVEVMAYNAEEYVRSGGLRKVFAAKGQAKESPIELYAIVGGVSEYGDKKLNLRFAAKDAEDMARAIEAAATNLFGAEKVHVKLLVSGRRQKEAGSTLTPALSQRERDVDGGNRRLPVAPTKENFRTAFEEVKAKAKAGDVVVVYLAGHGVSLTRRGTDLYCYGTAEARSLDPAVLVDDAIRMATTITSEELAEWTKVIPAQRQVMILDTCAAGAAAAKLTEKRARSSDEIRAMERLKDRTGFHVLLGCAADRVSYEASRYAQGVLTYSLLEAMSNAAALEGAELRVNKLFQYSVDHVPRLAGDIGGLQKPMVIAPAGATDFPIGLLTPEDRREIPLAVPKPVLIRPLLHDENDDDPLNLMALLSKGLYDANYSPRGGTGGEAAPFVFFDTFEYDKGIRPTGSYSVADGMVKVRINLRDTASGKSPDKLKVYTFEVSGSKEDLTGVVAKIVEGLAIGIRELSR